MSLQGTLRTLGIAEVLEFLAGRNATGRLEITANSGHATYWVSNGEIAAVDYSFARESGSDAAEATYYALAELEGLFHFDEDQRPEQVESTESVADVLSRTADAADGWAYVEDVIASPDHWLTRSETLEEAVSVQPEWWTALAEIDAGLSSQMLAQRLDMRALAASTMASEMVRNGLLQVSDPRVVAEEHAPVDVVEPAVEATAHEDTVEPTAHEDAVEPTTHEDPVEPTAHEDAVEAAVEPTANEDAVEPVAETEVEGLIDAPFLEQSEVTDHQEAEVAEEIAAEAAAPAPEATDPAPETEEIDEFGLNLFGGGAPAAESMDTPSPADPAPHLSVVEEMAAPADPFADVFQSEAAAPEMPATPPDMPAMPAYDEVPAQAHEDAAFEDADESHIPVAENPTPDSWDDDDGWASDHSQTTVAAAVGEAFQQAPTASDVFGSAPATDAPLPPQADAAGEQAGEGGEYGTDDRSSVLKFLRRD